MSRLLRRKQSPLDLNSVDKTKKGKLNTPSTSPKKTPLGVLATKLQTKPKITRASKKLQEQDENAAPSIKKTNTRGQLTTESLKPGSKNKNPILLAKSPVFRDRTNESLSTASPNKEKMVKEQSKPKPSQIEKPKPKTSLERKKLSQNETEDKEPRVLRTRSGGKLSTGKNNSQDLAKEDKKVERADKNKKTIVPVENNDPVEKTKVKNLLPRARKFFTSKPSENPVTAKPLKEVKPKRKYVKKTVLNDSSFNVPIVATKVTPSGKKTLRSRKDVKNYCEESKVTEEIKIVVEKLPPDPNEKKVPIWKTVQFSEAKNNGKDVYDMSESDFSFEEKPKGKKHVKKTVKRLKKSVKFAKTVKSKPEEKVPKKGKTPVQSKVSVVPEVPENPNQNPVPQVPVNPKLSTPIHKPQVVSVKVLDNKNKVNIVPSPQEFRPFRVTQNFHPRPTILHQNMSDHSLLSKTLSPIARVEENVDLSTPWRLPPIENFSRVRNLVQSTPQIKLIPKRPTLVEKPVIENKSETVEKILQEPKISDNLTPVKSKPIEENYEIPHVASPGGASFQNSFSDDVEDKENAVPNYQSPEKKSPRKKSNFGTPVFEPQPGPSGLQKQQPFRELKVLRQTNLNNFLSLDDAPEKTEIHTPHGIFDDVHSTPISVRVSVKIGQSGVQNAFGFDYDESIDTSPIACEEEEKAALVPLKGILQEKKENRQREKLSVSRRPVRFSAKDVLKTLHKRRIEKEENNKRNGEKKNEENVQSEVVPEQVKETEKDEQRVDFGQEENMETGKDEPQVEGSKVGEKEDLKKKVINLSDTFDLLEEDPSVAETIRVSSPLPLFMDLEPPTHFTDPPKTYYKRKRDRKFSLSEESEGDENRSVKEEKHKRRKRSTKQDKELKAWAKNINKTFEEIDNFDLVVE